MADTVLPITECQFDNGMIASKVGTWRPHCEPTRKDIKALREAAEAEGYSVLYISAAEPIEALEEHLQGRLIEFEGDRDTALAVLNRFGQKYSVRTVEPSDWPVIFDLYQHAFLTRFSRDPLVGLPRARRHKLKCMRTYQKNHPDFFLIAEDAQKQVVGVQGCMPRSTQFDLYESVILPQSRTGFAVAAMLRENLIRCRDRHPEVTKLVTRIYSDNIVSSNYYKQLGMSQSGGDYFYHLWIDQRRQPLTAMDKNNLRTGISKFLQERFLVDFGKNADGSTDLFKNGFIDSFGFMELVSYLETEFKIEYQPEELLLGQLNSLDGLVESVLAKSDAVSASCSAVAQPRG